MMSVRGALTEILLEVTNEEIRSIADETLSRTRLKGKVQCVSVWTKRASSSGRCVVVRSALVADKLFILIVLYSSQQTVLVLPF